MLNRIKTVIAVSIFAGITGVIGYHAEPVNQEPSKPKMDIPQTRIYNAQKRLMAYEIEQERIKQLSCLSMAVWGEARSESLHGQRLVAETILQRVDSPRFPSTICSVVYQPYQFSFTRDVNMGKANKAFTDEIPNKEVILAIKIAKDAISRPRRERIAGTHYHATYVNPKWNRDMKAIATVEKHIFYN